MTGTRLAAGLAILIAGAAAAGCGSPPSSIADGGDPFAWSPVVSGLDEAVLSVCNGSATTIAVGGAAGRGLVLEWTGVEWWAPPLPDGADVLWWCWVDEQGEPWAVGENATVLHRSAGGWSRVDTLGAIDDRISLYGVWGTSASDLWVVGGLPNALDAPVAIAHYDGTLWSPEEPGVSGVVLFKIWGTSASDVWAVGTGGTILHRDADGWTPREAPPTERLIAVWGRSPTDIYAVGTGADGSGELLRWDGSLWKHFAGAPEGLSGVWTAPDRPLYVAGNRGYVAAFDTSRDGVGGLIVPVAVSRAANDVDLHGVTGVGDALLAAGSDLFGGGATSWRGALFAHGGDFAGPLVRGPDIDAGIDAGDLDAGDGGIDAPEADAGDGGLPPGPGEPCWTAPPFCGPGLECWNILATDSYVCTELCTDVSDCSAYPNPCCDRPGFQTLDTVCIPNCDQGP